MILEYLFLDNNMRKKVEEYIHSHIGKSISVTYLESGAQHYWAIRFEVKGDNIESAKLLSAENDKFTNFAGSFHPITLTNGSAEFFNKKLYPLINQFERLLRKYLYVKTAICEDKEVRSKIKNLENKNFNEIADLLFVDTAFCNTAKQKINVASSKEDMIKILDELEERTRWDIMGGRGTLDIVQENFDKLKSYRNDVMHAHNINFIQYNSIRKLFEDINKKLTLEIEKTIKFQEPSASSREFAKTMKDSFETEDRIIRAKEFVNKWVDMAQNLSSLQIRPEVVDAVEKIIAAMSNNTIESNGDLESEDNHE